MQEKNKNQVNFAIKELIKSFEVKINKIKKDYEAKMNNLALLSVSPTVFQMQIVPEHDNPVAVYKVLSEMTEKYDEQIKMIN